MAAVSDVAALAALPLLVLGVFFVLPVAGMVGRGFFTDGRFDPGAVVDVLGRARVQRVLWFTRLVGGRRDRRHRACSGCRWRSRCTGCGSPAAGCCGRSC